MRIELLYTLVALLAPCFGLLTDDCTRASKATYGQAIFGSMSSDSAMARTPEQILSLNYIRSVLQRLEDTILFQLIERAQYAHNAVMYQPGAIPELQEKEHWDKSWTEWFLKENESAHSKVRRWQAPGEYPYTDIALLPTPILPPVQYPDVLYKPAIVQVNDRIYAHYRDNLVPILSKRSEGQVSLYKKHACCLLTFGQTTCRTTTTVSTEVRRCVTWTLWPHYRSVYILVSVSADQHCQNCIG
jgi:hypothetical protein